MDVRHLPDAFAADDLELGPRQEQGLGLVGVAGREEERLAVAAEGPLEDPRERGVAVGHVDALAPAVAAAAQRRKDVDEARQGPVDGAGIDVEGDGVKR